MISYNPKEILENISEIANKMINCEYLCEAEEIVCDKENGRSPRCLFFEYEGKDHSIPGWVIVGLNPAPADNDEVIQVKKWSSVGSLNYKNMLNSFLESNRNDKFYGPLMRLISSCNFNGPILWSEIAHCETKLGKDNRPITPKRVATSVCSRLYLSKEIKSVPDDWLIIAVGVDAYELLLPMCPDNKLIGIPHPNYRAQTGAKSFYTKVKNNPAYFLGKVLSLTPGGFYRFKE